MDKCIIDQTKAFGVEVRKESTGFLSDCQFSNCEKGFLQGTEQSNIIVNRGKFGSGSDENSALFFLNCTATINDSTITDYLSNQIVSNESANVTVNNSVLIGANYPAVAAIHHGKLTLNKCQISNIRSAAAIARIEAEIELNDTKITDCDDGVNVSHNSKANVKNSQIILSKGRGVAVYDEAQAVIDNATISTNSFPGVDVFTLGRVEVLNSKISSKAASPIQGRFGATLSVKSSTLVQEPAGSLLLTDLRLLSILSGNTLNSKFLPESNKTIAAPETALYAPLCIKCHKIQSDAHFLLPCLHRPFCKKCYQEQPKCPLCLRRVEKTINEIIVEEGDICPVCRFNPVQGVVPDCKHAFCKQCVESWLSGDGKGCMTCRNPDDFVIFPEYQ